MRKLGVEERGSSDQVLAQRKLAQLEQVEDEWRAIKKKRKELVRSAEDIMKGGARVQSGKHDVEPLIYWQRHIGYKKFCTDEQIEEARRRTPYTAHYRLKVWTRHDGNGKKK
jgi:hypothetical protein